jgi:hypothetical protein
MSLTVLAYNLKRVIAILGVPAMSAVLVASRNGIVSVTPVIILLVVGMIIMSWWWVRTISQEFSHGLALCSAARGSMSDPAFRALCQVEISSRTGRVSRALTVLRFSQ